MPFKKGKSGNPGGGWRAKPFREALRLELDKAGYDLQTLRQIASALIKKAKNGDSFAIKEVADRMDGKPAQETSLTIDDKRDATDWDRAELVAFLSNSTAGGRGTAEATGRVRKSDKVH